MTTDATVSAFGVGLKAKLSSPAIQGAPEDQVRAPLEKLIADMGLVVGLPAGAVGTGFVDNVTPAMWAYEASGKNVQRQWFSYRRRHRAAASREPS